jgi:hypothetical protein
VAAVAAMSGNETHVVAGKPLKVYRNAYTPIGGGFPLQVEVWLEQCLATRGIAHGRKCVEGTVRNVGGKAQEGVGRLTGECTDSGRGFSQPSCRNRPRSLPLDRLPESGLGVISSQKSTVSTIQLFMHLATSCAC